MLLQHALRATAPAMAARQAYNCRANSLHPYPDRHCRGDLFGRSTVCFASASDQHTAAAPKLCEASVVQQRVDHDTANSSDQAGTDSNDLADPPSQRLLKQCTASNAVEYYVWSVPWDLWTTAQVMVQLWCLMLPLGFGGAAIVAQLRGLPMAELTPLDKALTALCVETFLVAAVLWLIHRSIRTSLGPDGPHPLRWFEVRLDAQSLGLGLAGGVAALLGGAGIYILAGDGHAARATGELTEMVAGFDGPTVAATAAASCLLAPVAEELVYRGFLLPSLATRMPTAAAVVVSGAVFAAAHLAPGDFMPLALLGTTLGGVAVAARGNLAAPLLAHSMYNAVILASLLAATAGAAS